MGQKHESRPSMAALKHTSLAILIEAFSTSPQSLGQSYLGGSLATNVGGLEPCVGLSQIVYGNCTEERIAVRTKERHGEFNRLTFLAPRL